MASIHYWTEEEKTFLKDNVKGRMVPELIVMFKEEFGIELRPKQLSGMIKRMGLTSGVNTQFKKGMPAHNKGKAMEIDIYSKCEPTMFKPGSVPPNTDPIGTEKLCTDGYVWVKIDNQPKAKKIVNWKQKHKLLWEQHNGPVPKGHKVIFLDGNRENIVLENLALVSDSELLIMNKRKLIYDDKDLTKVGVNIAKLIDTTNKKKNVNKS